MELKRYNQFINESLEVKDGESKSYREGKIEWINEIIINFIRLFFGFKI